MSGPELVPGVVNSEKVPDKDVPLLLVVYAFRLVEKLVEVLPDAPVDGVQVPDVEGGIRVGGVEPAGEQAHPGVVSGEHDPLAAALPQLVNDVVLRDGVRAEVGGDVDEGGQAAGGHALKALHCRRRRVGEELEQPAVARSAQLVEDGQPVAVVGVALPLARTCLVRLQGELIFESVHDQHDRLVEQLGRALRLADDGPVLEHLPAEQEPAREEVEGRRRDRHGPNEEEEVAHSNNSLWIHSRPNTPSSQFISLRHRHRPSSWPGTG